MIINPYVFGVAFDADAQAFITASGISDSTQQNAINTLVTDLKGYGIWTKMKAIYPFVGGTASTHKWNLKDPRDLDAAYRLTFSGGWTHNSNGILPNGTNAYANTYLKPNLALSLNSNSIGYYSGSNLAETSSDPVNMGAFESTSTATSILKSNTTFSSRMNGNLITYSTATMKGFFNVSKQSSTVSDIYLNGSQVATANSGGSLPANIIFMGTLCIDLAFNPYSAGWVKNDFRLSYISDGLSDIESSNLYTAVQSFQTTLGRQA